MDSTNNRTEQKFDFEGFLKSGFSYQDNIDKASGLRGLSELSKDDRYRRVLDMIGHLNEEISGEVRSHIKRRNWRKDEKGFLDDPDIFDDYLEELVDVLLFYRAILVYSDIKPCRFVEALNRKINKNSKREDHVR